MLLGQFHDNNWLFGFSPLNNPMDSVYGTSIIDFDSQTEPHVYYERNSEVDFDGLNVSMSDANGNYIFSTGGLYIEDAAFNIMQNGDSLNLYDTSDTGYRLPQGAIALPYPEHPDKYVLFHATKTNIEEPDWGPKIIKLYYSLIDMNENDGLGAVIQKNQLIINDTLSYGFMTACKHANGRDWWVLINKYPSNNFYKLLLDENGVHINDVQPVGDVVSRGLGQAVFSPDGTKYVQYMGVSTSIGNYLYLYDFDRCTGELSNFETIHTFGVDYSQGAVISPNSRFLYLPADYFILQYDLWVENIESSRDTVAEYDGFGDPFGTRFFLGQLAPDGKIYISSNTSSNYLTIIHQPDEAGDDCMVEQHGLRLPTRNFTSIPNNPNYRLGPLDESICDTLGLDNNPIAKYRYQQDTLDILSISFKDLSYYEPEEWCWNFGDGETSTERSPWHFFPEQGVYEVCLTVTNKYSSHTICHELYLGVTATGEPAPEIDVLVYPNPVSDYFYLQYSATESVDVILYDGLGRAIQQKKLVLGNDRRQDWDVHKLRAGVYYLIGTSDGRVLFRKKVVVY